MHKVANTIAYLRQCQRHRAVGMTVYMTTDPEWLVDMAINRRAGWPDDPTCQRGSARPVNGRQYPAKAAGDAYRHLELLARAINTPRLVVHIGELGEWRQLLLRRLPQRFCAQDG